MLALILYLLGAVLFTAEIATHNPRDFSKWEALVMGVLWPLCAAFLAVALVVYGISGVWGSVGKFLGWMKT